MNSLDAMNMLSRIEAYLFATTYTGLSYDYDRARQFWETVNIVRNSQQQVREVIASQIGAVLA